jgi:hypothetical protein
MPEIEERGEKISEDVVRRRMAGGTFLTDRGRRITRTSWQKYFPPN